MILGWSYICKGLYAVKSCCNQCMSVCTHGYMYTYVCASVCICVYVWIEACVYECVCKYVCVAAYVYLCVCMWVWKCVCTQFGSNQWQQVTDSHMAQERETVEGQCRGYGCITLELRLQNPCLEHCLPPWLIAAGLDLFTIPWGVSTQAQTCSTAGGRNPVVPDQLWHSWNLVEKKRSVLLKRTDFTGLR